MEEVVALVIIKMQSHMLKGGESMKTDSSIEPIKE